MLKTVQVVAAPAIFASTPATHPQRPLQGAARSAAAMVESVTPKVADEPAVQLNELRFCYPGCKVFIDGVSLELPRGSRALLIGANGAGAWRGPIELAPAAAAAGGGGGRTWPRKRALTAPRLSRGHMQARQRCCS